MKVQLFINLIIFLTIKFTECDDRFIDFYQGDVYILGVFSLGNRHAGSNDEQAYQSLLAMNVLSRSIVEYNSKQNAYLKLGYAFYRNFGGDGTVLKTVLQNTYSSAKGINTSNTIGVFFSSNHVSKPRILFENFIHADTPIFIVSPGINVTTNDNRTICLFSQVFYETTLFHQTLKHFDWRKFGIVSLGANYDRFVNRHALKVLTQDQNLCVYYTNLNLTDAQSSGRFFQRLHNNSSSTNIFLIFGSRNDTETFFQYADTYNITGKIWIGNSAWSNHLEAFNLKNKSVFHGVMRPQVESVESFFEIYSNLTNQEPSWYKQYNNLTNTTSTFWSNEQLDVDEVHILTATLQSISKSMLEEKDTQKTLANMTANIRQNILHNHVTSLLMNLTAVIYEWDQNMLHNIMVFRRSEGVWNTQLPWLPYRNGTSCQNITCASGFKNINIYRDNYSAEWSHSFGPVCERCSALDKEASCQDIEYEYLQYLSSPAYTIYGTMALGLITALSVCLIFYIFRNTPYVKASHQQMSLVQLFAHFLLFIAPIMFIGEPSEMICTSRPIVFGILFTFIMAMTLTKTQKLVFIFESRLRVSKRQVQMSQTMEISLILLMLIVQSCIAGLSYLVSPSRVVIAFQEDSEKHVLKCNTEEEFLIQLLFGMLLALMCMMQAFKARHLPENFNETKLIFCTTILCVITVIICLPLRFYLQNDIDKLVIEVISLLTINYVLLITMYGHKCWIIIFKPELNTTSAFKENIQSHVLKGVLPNHVTMMSHRGSANSDTLSVDLHHVKANANSI